MTKAETPPPAVPSLRLGAYEGPLDLLLDLARAQRVDLARISMLELAEQFAAAVEAGIAARRFPLHRMADWVVMAAWLTLLRSRLLLPLDSPEARAAEDEAAEFRRKLENRAFLRAALRWLEARPQLGRDHWARGMPETLDERAAPVADIAELLRACLKLLEQPERSGAYRPDPPPLWRLPEALAWMRRILGTRPGGAPLEALLPPPTGQPVQRRAALASTFLAGLELARDGTVTLAQEVPFGPLHVAPGQVATAAAG